MNNGQLSLVGPIAPIISAMITGIITIAITYFFIMKRKSVGFRVSPTEDLTRSLQGQHRQIVVSVDGQPFLNLNRGTVRVKNTGNVSVEGLQFDIEIPGEHHGYLADAIEGDPQLRKAITITTDQPPITCNPTFHVNVPTFINPKETFGIAVFFDNELVNFNVRCRVADVKAKVRLGEPVSWADFSRADLKDKSLFVVGLLFIMFAVFTSTVVFTFVMAGLLNKVCYSLDGRKLKVYSVQFPHAFATALRKRRNGTALQTKLGSPAPLCKLHDVGRSTWLIPASPACSAESDSLVGSRLEPTKARDRPTNLLRGAIGQAGDQRSSP